MLHLILMRCETDCCSHYNVKGAASRENATTGRSSTDPFSTRATMLSTSLFTWKLDPTDVSRMAGHANYRTTLDMYVKSRELHLTGEVCGVCPRAEGLNAALAAYCGSLVNWDYAGTNPPDARSSRLFLGGGDNE